MNKSVGSIRAEHLGEHEVVDPCVNSGNRFLLGSTSVRPHVHLMSVLWWTGVREVLALLWRVAGNRQWRHRNRVFWHLQRGSDPARHFRYMLELLLYWVPLNSPRTQCSAPKACPGVLCWIRPNRLLSDGPLRCCGRAPAAGVSAGSLWRWEQVPLELPNLLTSGCALAPCSCWGLCFSSQ